MSEAPAGRDLCLLVEGDGPAVRLRPAWVPLHARLVIEQPRLAEGLSLPDRRWVWRGERAETGQRVFREELPPPPREEPEKPLYDEMKVRVPLKVN